MDLSAYDHKCGKAYSTWCPILWRQEFQRRTSPIGLMALLAGLMLPRINSMTMLVESFQTLVDVNMARAPNDALGIDSLDGRGNTFK